ncbi:MAG: hypothetical protein H0Z18_10850 [Thermococcus sp.]|uniref:hypothetical protein n=1 Tax=Thermococcus sp. TaxID=35749 RepID=UPI001D811123|nr:hypothetical protein [Thermococcus sp.]MBO8175744.1 hypothetical protein [Thermococcus sp.]
MRKRIISVLVFIYIIMNIGLVTAWSWEQNVSLGDHILIYRNDTLLYNITIDVNKRDNMTYAIIKDAEDTLISLSMIEWNSVEIDDSNITIVSTEKDLKKLTAKIIISAPYNLTVKLQSELARETVTNQTNTTEINNQTVPVPVNLTPVVIPENLTCSSVEECQAIIDNLTKQLEQPKQERDALVKQIQYLQLQLNITQTEKKQLEEQIKILQRALEERNKKIRELEEEIERLKAEQWSWETARQKMEDQYILWTPYIFPLVLGSLVVYYRKYKRTRKYMDVKIDLKAKELKEELLSEYLKKDILRAKIETIVDDPNLLVILRTIIPQITGSTEITKGDILNIDIDKVAELARKRFLLKENRVEYLKKKLLELKERIKEEAEENV